MLLGGSGLLLDDGGERHDVVFRHVELLESLIPRGIPFLIKVFVHLRNNDFWRCSPGERVRIWEKVPFKAVIVELQLVEEGLVIKKLLKGQFILEDPGLLEEGADLPHRSPFLQGKPSNEHLARGELLKDLRWSHRWFEFILACLNSAVRALERREVRYGPTVTDEPLLLELLGDLLTTTPWSYLEEPYGAIRWIESGEECVIEKPGGSVGTQDDGNHVQQGDDNLSIHRAPFSLY